MRGSVEIQQDYDPSENEAPSLGGACRLFLGVCPFLEWWEKSIYSKSLFIDGWSNSIYRWVSIFRCMSEIYL